MSPEKHLLDWQTSQTIAESIAPTLGQLYRQKGVEVILFGKTLVNATTIDIIKAHRIAKTLHWFSSYSRTDSTNH